MRLTTRAATRLAQLEAADLRRTPPPVTGRDGVHYELAGTRVVGFCSNDYLGLAATPTPRDRGQTGAGASRLIAGDLPEHRELEHRLAALVRAEDAVLFPSGFQLNVGVLPCLIEATDIVHSDRLNHASLIDGLRLAKQRPRILAHGTAPPSPRSTDALTWWITESVFSMDGDRIDPRTVARFQRDGGTVYIDDAHAFGLFPGGAGLFHAADPQPDVIIGTLSKAYGCAGAFVGASRAVCDLIRNRARSFVFSTGVAPTVARDIAHRIDLVAGPHGDELRARLWTNARRFEAALLGHDPAACDPPSPIFPLVVGDNATTLDLARRLLDRGLHVQAIRPPTVPHGTARLRVTLSAAHTAEHIDHLAHELRRVLTDADVPVRLDRGATHTLATPTTAAAKGR